MTEFKPGDRVQTHPATDAWMSGDRYGTVTKIFSFAPRTIHVKMDRSGKTRKFSEENLLSI